MPLASGTKLGPYEIVAPLGAGGMGEVYRARDTRLGRDVALKILPDSFARDEDRLHRFEQESRAVAALNHPNILAIHDVGQHNGCPFLVSELLEGESLRSALDRGVMPQRKAIEFAVQVTQGLAAAHEKGIVHRDLKPENLFVTRDGRAKILDFGLAKLAQTIGLSSDGLTLTSAHTAAGVVLGTASYMAPEQVRGEATDARTDIFSFGVVLFEMLSGRRAFRRDTAAETMTAVLKEDPAEISDATHSISPALDRTVRRCLEKNPEQRFQSAKDLSFALSALSGTDASGAARATAPSREIPWLRWALTIAALGLAAGLTWRLARRPADTARIQFAIPVPGEVSQIALSPDGRMLAFISLDEQSSQPILFVQRVGSGSANELPGTEGASYPFWSPDGTYVAFFAKDRLQKVAVSGGTPLVLASAAMARGGAWGSKNVILYAPDVGNGVLWRVNADGTGAAPLAESMLGKDENTHRFPVFLPDGEHFLLFVGNFKNLKDDPTNGIYLSSLDAKEKKLIVLARSNPGYGSGSLFYVDDKRELVAVPLDISAGKTSGEPRVIAPQVGFQPSTYWSAFAVAENGTVVLSPTGEVARSVLTWMDRSGKELGKVGEPGVLANPSLSPNGERVAVDVSDLQANNVDVWIESVKGGGSARFTFDPTEEAAGVFSRDGSRVAYRSASDNPTVYAKAASGLEQPKAVVAPGPMSDILPNSWSSDDREILCTLYVGLSVSHTGGYSDLMIASTSDHKLTPFVTTPASESNGQISPDGKWAAYASDETGEWEVYVTTFPGAAGKWQVSRGGGTEPRWPGDGKQIFYVSSKGTLTAVPVSTAGTFSSSVPVALFQTRGRAPISSTDIFTYDVAKDGTRFLINRYVKPESLAPLTILLHALGEPPK
jgi:Tol biopolymer transport system component